MRQSLCHSYGDNWEVTQWYAVHRLLLHLTCHCGFAWDKPCVLQTNVNLIPLQLAKYSQAKGLSDCVMLAKRKPDRDMEMGEQSFPFMALSKKVWRGNGWLHDPLRRQNLAWNCKLPACKCWAWEVTYCLAWYPNLAGVPSFSLVDFTNGAIDWKSLGSFPHI